MVKIHGIVFWIEGYNPLLEIEDELGEKDQTTIHHCFLHVITSSAKS